MSRKHDAWLKARIETVPALAAATFVTTAPAATATPYVVLHPMDGSDDSDRFTGPSTVQHPRYVVHSVGETPEQAKWAAEQVKSKLVVAGVGVVPTIAGELAGAVSYSSPAPVQVDRDGPAVLFVHIAECGFESTLA